MMKNISKFLTLILSIFKLETLLPDYLLQGEPNIAESLLPKNSSILGIFGDMGTTIIFFVQNDKRVGVRNDVICRTFFFNSIRSLTIGSNQKCVELNTPPNAIK